MNEHETRSVIFGVIPVDDVDSTVFLLEDAAHENAQAYEAANSANTWGEFRTLCPASMLQEIEEILADNEEEHDDEDDFDSSDIPGYADGTWPGFPERDQSDWFPEKLKEKYAVLIETLHDGTMLQFSVSHQENIVRELIGMGFQCERNDELVKKACGY